MTALPCPVAATCEVCGAARSDLAVWEADTTVGVVCLTLCPGCADAGDLPARSTFTTLDHVWAHCEHLGVDVDGAPLRRGDPVTATTVTVPDTGRPVAVLTVRPHHLFPAARYVFAIEWSGVDGDMGNFHPEAVTLGAAEVRAVRDAMTAWLDTQAVTR
jgi:hypothetical protein